jgi:hypothetical protein
MSRRSLHGIVFTAVLVASAASTPAFGTGYWNLPSNFCQCLGCGFGAGYHTPLILGPATWDGVCAHNEVRLPCAPTPPYGSYGHCNCSSHFSAPSILDPTPSPPVESPVPLTRRPRPLFLR